MSHSSESESRSWLENGEESLKKGEGGCFCCCCVAGSVDVMGGVLFELRS